MQIYPAIDLKSGQCVRLYKGDYDQMTVYEKNPVNLAKSFKQQNADMLHVVDLDGAKTGESINADIILKIYQETGLKIQTGGGIRTREKVSKLLSQGIARVIIGSIAISQPGEVLSWLEEFGSEKIVLALDIRWNKANEPVLAQQGWVNTSDKTLWELLDYYQKGSIKHVLCTDIARDGTLSGPNFALYQECMMRYPTIQFQASGGISSLRDIQRLKQTAIAGVIIGKALYENIFSLQEVMSC